jgi:PAS domain S-box-containing protein
MPAHHPAEVLRTLLDASPFGIIAIDAAGDIRLWSRGAEQIFRWSEEEMLGRALPLDLRLEAQLQGGPRESAELLSRRKDGTTLPVEVRSAPWRDEQGEPKGAVLIVSDMTARQALQRELMELTEQESEARRTVRAERRFRELLEAAPDAILEVDRDGRVVMTNRAAEEMFGYSREELLGRSVDQLIPKNLRETHQRHRANYWDAPRTRAMGSGLFLEAERGDGSRFPVEISLSPVKFEDGFRVTAIIRDISDRKQADARLRAAEEQHTRELSAKNQELEERNRLVERANRLKSEFLASMSHELRTPLHTIIGFSELLGEELEGPLNDKQKRFVEHIHSDSMHLLELINDVLDLSKIESGRVALRPEDFDASSAVDEVVASIRPQCDAKSIGIEAAVSAGTMIHADRLRFKQILLNLVGNAVKFTPEAGNIRIEATLPEGDQPAVEISVIDTGIGIPPEEQTSIFDKFYQIGNTTKGVREGTGLGLAITAKLVAEHGGTIRVTSDVGRGSRFTFTIPRGGSKGSAA